MRTTRLGCFSLTGIIAAAITLLAITGAGLASGGLIFNPGQLNDVKGTEPLGGVYSHAETAGRCAACHTAFWENSRMADRCILCHVGLITNPKDFHGVMLAQSRGLSCTECHTDHVGSHGDLTVLEMESFPHNDAMGFSLQAHQKLADGSNIACRDCHGSPIATFEQGTCSECHDAMDEFYMISHRGDFGDNCLACHDGIDRYGKGFDHNQLAFPLDGEHTSVACVDCHGRARSMEDLRATSHQCSGCHLEDDPHQTLLGTACAECHVTGSWQMVHYDHSLSAFPLMGEHAEVACEQCHQDLAFKGTPQTCWACHAVDDPHAGQFGQECAACHTPQDWDEVSFDHSSTAFPLSGAHAGAACLDCHQNGVLKGTPQSCIACHAGDDAHAGSLGQDCAMCHSSDNWQKIHFNHDQSSFHLTGLHAQVDCAGCHQQGVFKGTPQVCYACHAKDDPHAGSLGKDCSACHNAQGWDEVTFDHARSAFPLTGAHRGTSCTACHLNQVYRGISSACVSCHADPAYHRGLFSASCDACHDTQRWLPARYDKGHRFPFSHGGAGRDCQTCHPDQLSSYTCFGCHEHNRAKVLSEHQEEGIGDINNCVRCHPNGTKEDDDGGGDDD